MRINEQCLGVHSQRLLIVGKHMVDLESHAGYYYLTCGLGRYARVAARNVATPLQQRVVEVVNPVFLSASEAVQ